VTGGEPIAVLWQSISGVSAINPLVAFYDIHGGKREVLFFYFVSDTTRELGIASTKQFKPECFGLYCLSCLITNARHCWQHNIYNITYLWCV
jgi:hypothetical protein